MKISLDTNAYPRLALHDPPLSDFVDEAEQVFISATVLGELYGGFQRGSRYTQNVKELERFLALPEVDIVSIDQAIAERYGLIYKTLRHQGTPIPTNDIWIAAAALETGSRLVTYDKHFEKIPGLMIISL